MSKVSNFFGWLTAIGFFGSFIVPFVGIPLAIIGFLLWVSYRPKKEQDKVLNIIDDIGNDLCKSIDRETEKLKLKEKELKKRLEELKNKNN